MTLYFHKYTTKKKRIEELERAIFQLHDHILEQNETIKLLEEYLNIKQHQPKKTYVKQTNKKRL